VIHALAPAPLGVQAIDPIPLRLWTVPIQKEAVQALRSQMTEKSVQGDVHGDK